MPRALHNPAFSRRGFLRAVGLPAAAASFLPLQNASGREKARPRRLILFFTPHGTIPDAWRPTGGEHDFKLGTILEALERHRKRINIIDHLQVIANGVGAPHTKGPPLLWTASPLLSEKTFVRRDASGGTYFGWNSGPSIDQVIARQVGGSTPYRSLELGLRSGPSHPGSRMIYSGPRQPLPPESNPHALLGRLFGTGGADWERLRASRKSTIDVLKADLDSFASEADGDDRHKLEAHLEAVRGIETRLEQRPVACKVAPRAHGGLDPDAKENTPVVLDVQMDILTAALACDLTRVASLQYRVGENDNDRYTWLGIEEGHHTLSHSGDSQKTEIGNLVKIYTWYADRFAHLLDRLASVRERDGTLLDNSLVIWGSEIGKGNSHTFERVPFIIAGSCDGAVKTGRFIDLPAKTPHNRLLVAAAHAMGVTSLQKFGSTDTGSGPLPGFLA
jgi:hypothetical protein